MKNSLRTRQRRVLPALAGISSLAIAGCAYSPPMPEPVRTIEAPAPIGPYSQGVSAGGLVFVSGQIGIPSSRLAGSLPDTREETRAAMDHIAAILRAANSGMDQVVQVQIFLVDLGDFSAVNDVYGTYFRANPPARVTVQVARLPKDARVEIAAIATQATGPVRH